MPEMLSLPGVQPTFTLLTEHLMPVLGLLLLGAALYTFVRQGPFGLLYLAADLMRIALAGVVFSAAFIAQDPLHKGLLAAVGLAILGTSLQDIFHSFSRDDRRLLKQGAGRRDVLQEPRMRFPR